MSTGDKTTDTNLNTVLPAIKELAEKAINELQTLNGIKVRCTFGYRSDAEQDKLYAIGRTIDVHKPRVTNAKGGQSIHNYKRAIDVVEISPKYGYDNNYDTSRWNTIASVFKKYGFEWGGDWKSFKDRPHFQILNGKTLTQLQQERKPL